MYFMDAFGPSISLLPLNGLSLDISKTYVCSASPYGQEHTATIEAGDYFILCNFMTILSTTTFGTTYIYIMSSSNSNKVYMFSTTGTFFYFKNTTTIAAKVSSSDYSLNLSLIKINS